MTDLEPSTTDKPGWKAELALRFAPLAGATRLVSRHHLGPLRVQRPFHPEGEVCHVYIVHPPGGIVGGDELDIRVEAMPGAQVLLTTPAAGKFYRSAGPEAVQQLRIEARDATVEWLPQETILYPAARARVLTAVHLQDAACFIGWEIVCLGLTAQQQALGAGRGQLGFELWRDGKPLLIDRLAIDGEGAMMGSASGLAGATVVASFVAASVDASVPTKLRALLRESQDVEAGLSVVDGVLVGRLLGRDAGSVKRACVRLWAALRPEMLQRPAAAPRIWAT